MAKRGVSGVIMRGLRAKDHNLTVLDRQTLAPHFVRIRMSSPTLFGNLDLAPTAWLRFWFPDTADGAREYQRGYTVTDADSATGEFSVNFVLHTPAGPASAWAATVQPGDTVQAMIYGSTKFEVPDELAAGYLLIGDSASMPAIASILEALPAEASVECYLEEHDAADHEIPMPDHPGTTIHWVPRRGPGSLAAAIEARDFTGWYAWVAPEAGSLKALRPRLRNEFGFGKADMYMQAYWVEGKTMGTQRGVEESAQ